MELPLSHSEPSVDENLSNPPLPPPRDGRIPQHSHIHTEEENDHTMWV